MSIIVIAIKSGTPKQSVTLQDGATVSTLRSQLSADKMLATINGDTVSDDVSLEDGNVVTFTEQVKGASN